MIITKIYKYDSSAIDYLGEDFSDKLLLGYTYKNNLDDTLDTMDLTLIGLTRKEPFAPTTKFIIKIYEENNGIINQDSIQSFDMVVSDDAVEQPIMSDNNYFNHHLKLIEAGAIAQQRLVDNIAVTYKLKDVSLDIEPTYDQNEKINLSTNNAIYTGSTEKYGYHNIPFFGYYVVGHKFLWVMPNYYNVTLNGTTKLPEFTDWTDMLKNQELGQNETSKTLELPLPMLECWGWNSGNSNLRRNGLCSYNVELQKKNIITNKVVATDKYTINPIDAIPQNMLVSGFNSDYENQWVTDNNETTGLDNGKIIYSRIKRTSINSIGTASWRTRIAETGSTMDGIDITDGGQASFSGITNRVLSLTIEKNYSYIISLKLKSFTYGTGNWDTYPALYCKWKDGRENPEIVSYTTSTYPLFSTYFDVYEAINKVILFESAKPYTAYQLFNKAQIASQTIQKIDGTPIEETEKTFYVDNDTKKLLEDTVIIESYYNEKNLWEIFMDIGKYIHAKPFIEFGENDKLKLSFKKYGVTDRSTKPFNKVSVYNSQFIQEYVSSLSSYVTNMVQLGGVINEIVAPKSSSDDYLIYNDVAEIIVTKPIIELIDLVAIRKSDWEEKSLVYNENDATWSGCVFEKSIYNLLGVSENESINKGNSIYYENGTNKIQGLNYKLPSQNNDKPYAIKVILANLFNITSDIDVINIKVNDYLFKVVYRTIDSLRTEQTRPDLRKYLKNSKFDNVPIHNQFNNQQDIIVDSQKFGTNVYGKLIRTGNEVYSVVDWIDSLVDLKIAGELYNIFDNLYYVSKNTTTYFSDHAVSEIEFTKDFNRLAQIIGIPSEPRFYEIATKNLINRECVINDYLYLTTIKNENAEKINNFIKPSGFNYIRSLLFDEMAYNKYSITIFKNDKDKITLDNPDYDGYFQKSIIMPLNSYSIGQTLTMEWDMEDNTIAGNQVTQPGNLPSQTQTDSYYSLSPYGYADVYNRADLMDFAIINDVDYYGLDEAEKNEKIMNYPASPIENVDINPLFGNQNYGDYGNLTSGLGLLKDNREIIKINYNIQMLSDSDRFILSNWIWQQNKTDLKLVLLSKEVNKLSTLTIQINDDDILEELDLSYDTEDEIIEPTIDSNGINIPILELINSQIQDISNLSLLKAIAIMGRYASSSERYFVMARNVEGLADSAFSASILIGDNLSNIAIDTNTFATEVGTYGTYIFNYSTAESSWTLDGTDVLLETYGISVEGTPTDGDAISVIYTNEKIQDWYIIIPPKNIFNNQ